MTKVPQTLNDLKVTGLERAPVINFAPSSLEYKRLALKSEVICGNPVNLWFSDARNECASESDPDRSVGSPLHPACFPLPGQGGASTLRPTPSPQLASSIASADRSPRRFPPAWSHNFCSPLWFLFPIISQVPKLKPRLECCGHGGLGGWNGGVGLRFFYRGRGFSGNVRAGAWKGGGIGNPGPGPRACGPRRKHCRKGRSPGLGCRRRDDR